MQTNETTQSKYDAALGKYDTQLDDSPRSVKNTTRRR